MKDLHDQLSGEPDPDHSAVASVVADRGNWLFAKDAATVHFTVYAVASFDAPSGFYWAARRHHWLPAPQGIRIVEEQ